MNKILGALTVGQRIKLVRKKMLGIDQSSFSHLVGVSQFTVSKWERNEAEVSEDYLRILAQKTNLTLEWYRDGDPVSDSNLEVIRLLSMVSDKITLALFEKLLETYFKETKAGRRIDGRP